MEASPRAGGIFRIADPSGARIEGTYVEVIPDRKVVFTWGGVEGLEPGQSTVEFVLDRDGNATLLRLRHYGLPEPSVDSHHRIWEVSGLPKLKDAAEGRQPSGRCLADAVRQGAQRS